MGLPTVTIGELNRAPGAVVDRVLRGERLIVVRHRRPVATLQPLNGIVEQPISGQPHDVYGEHLSDELSQLRSLTEIQKAVLRDGISYGRYVIGRINSKWSLAETREAVDDLLLRGLLTKSPGRGMVLTGRGLVLREELLTIAGKNPTDCWLGRRSV